MNFTQSQHEAIFTRGCSVLVSAGAGSGKTRVLTERLMEYIDPSDPEALPEDIDRFLVITFTRAAASELKSRIADAISDRLSLNPGNRHLRRQLVLCRTAPIGTIHSFCGQLLRDHAELAGISPAFRILEEEKSGRMLETALESLLERRYKEASESFLHLADYVGAGRDDRHLAETLLKLYHSAQSHAVPEQWLNAQIEASFEESENIGETEWGRALLKDISAGVSFWAEQMEAALGRMRENPAVRKAYEKSFSETADGLRALEGALSRDWDEAMEQIPVPFPRIGTVKAEEDRPLAEELKAVRKQCSEEMKRLRERVFTGSSRELMLSFRETAADRRELLQLCLELDAEFRGAKRRINALDFSDLEHMTYRLLTGDNGERSALAEEQARRFREIMVDEYQDVSRVQDAVFQAVSRDGNNLFLVGDVKQSIYRFRLADPMIFTEKSRLWAEASSGGKLILLQENFRSRPEILNAVNEVFRRCMSEELGELDYGPADCLRPGTEQPDSVPLPELLLLSSEDAAGEGLQAEAALVGRKILELMRDTRVQDEEGERPLRFGDIAVLLRSANSDGGVFRSILNSMKIPVSAGAGEDFYSSMEVSTVFSMLMLIDNPHRDIPLLTVLRSPAFGFTPDRLSMIRAASPDTDYYTALRNAEGEDTDAFLRLLGELRASAADLDPVRLVERIVEELELYAVCSAMSDAETRIRRLTELSLMAKRFLETGERGLHRFIRWIEAMRSKRLDPGGGTESGDAVQILSIHRSKGLEFPVVFVSALGKQFNQADIRSPMLIHPRLGLGPKYTDPMLRAEYPTVARRAIAQVLTGEMKSEELRLLYVAMTRAKERLIMTACLRKAEEQLFRAETLTQWEKIPARLLQSAQSPVLWLLPSAAAGKSMTVRICDSEQAENAGQENPQESAEPADPELLRSLEAALRYRYPAAAAQELPSKLTATELKDRAEPDPDGEPLFQEDSFRGFFRSPEPDLASLSASDRGTAAHIVLQQIDFAKTGSLEEIKAEIARLREQEFLSEEEAESVSPEMVYRFYASDLGRRILKAGNAEREFRFSLLCEAAELLGEAPPGEKILLQGAVDCFFEEDGELVVVDYKTDRFRDEESFRERTGRYRRQLETYAMALRRITGLPVKERYLYYLSSERCLAV